jgi:serine phosphatase RsbU (regulator of sigma subunit)
VSRSVSIRRSLLTNLIVVVVLLGLGILAMSLLSGRRALSRFSQSLITQTLHRTDVQLHNFFDPVARQLGTMRSWAEAGMLDFENPQQSVEILMPSMREYPWVTSAMVADDSGREQMLLRQGDSWRSRQTSADEWGELAHWTDWDDGTQQPVVTEEKLGYDPRVRPWFRGAVAKVDGGESTAPGEASAIHWTEPYVFFTTKEPGITAAVAFHGPDTRLWVVGLDVLLTDIARFTRSIDIQGRGKVFVLADDGRLIGLPRGEVADGAENWKQDLLKRADELDDAVAHDAARALPAGEAGLGVATRFHSEGQAWWGVVEPFALAPDRQFLIGVVVPEADLIGDLNRQRLWIAVLTVSVLGLAVGRAVILARRYSRPIESLVHESERIATGELEPGQPIESSVTEVRRLAQAHDKMRAGLKTLLKIERDLQLARRIQQNTFPKRLPALVGFDIHAWSEPADETGGDTYDVIGVRSASIGDQIIITDENAGRAVMLLADATGHGIGPALSVTQVRAMLRIAVRMTSDLGEIVLQMNEQLCADLPSGRFITAWLGAVNAADHTLTSISAGQAPLLRYTAAADEFEVLQADATPLGLFDHLKIDEPKQFAMAPGDIFAVISDGIFESADADEKEFGMDRTMEVIRRYRDSSASEILSNIRSAVDAFTRGAPAADDRTIIMIKRT